MRQAVKQRIYPNQQQRIQISKILGNNRVVYNKMIDTYDRYQKAGKLVTFAQAKRFLNYLKQQTAYAFLNETDDSILSLTLWNLFRRYQAYQKGTATHPSYHSRIQTKQTFYLPNQGTIAIENHYLHVPFVGTIKMRKTSNFSHIYGVSIEKTNTNKYFAICHVEKSRKPQKEKKGVIGIDVGLSVFLTDSNGITIPNPRYLEQSLRKMRREQRKLSRRVYQSNNYKRQRLKVAKLYERITNQRNDFLHKLSIRLIRANRTICIETLKVKEMLQRKRLSKSILSISWSKFFQFLDYKGKWYGTTIIRVPTEFPSSQICSNCGYQNIETRDLRVRRWICPNCLQLHERDQNAAINILNKGLETVT